MKQATLINIYKRLIQLVDDRATEECESQLTESADIFTCPERFAREKQQFFIDTPQVIGFAGEVAAPNSYITRESMGIPILVTRDAEGILRAFVNACAHKGARVAHEHGEKQRLICKFHGWAYSMDGTLYGRPKQACFDKPGAECNLVELPVSDRSGLVVVGLHNNINQETVDHFLDDIQGEFSGFGFDKMHPITTHVFTVKANWKLVAGLSLESYHFSTLHRNSVAEVLHDNAIYDTFGKHSRWAFPMKGFDKIKHLDESKWPRVFNGAISHTLFPGTIVIKNPEDAQIIRGEPGDTVDETRIYYTGVCRQLGNIDNARKAYEFGGKVFENEDLPAAAECQQGLSGGREGFIIGKNEPVVQYWHKLWRDLLR